MCTRIAGLKVHVGVVLGWSEGSRGEQVWLVAHFTRDRGAEIVPLWDVGERMGFARAGRDIKDMKVRKVRHQGWCGDEQND